MERVVVREGRNGQIRSSLAGSVMVGIVVC